MREADIKGSEEAKELCTEFMGTLDICPCEKRKNKLEWEKNMHLWLPKIFIIASCLCNKPPV